MIEMNCLENESKWGIVNTNNAAVEPNGFVMKSDGYVSEC